MQTKKLVISLLLFLCMTLIFLSVCCNKVPSKAGSDENSMMDNNALSSMSSGINEFDNIVSYPYSTSIDFQEQIKTEIMNLKVGDTYENCISLLGHPTRITYLYDPMDIISINKTSKTNPSGFAASYIFTQKAFTGSAADKGIEGFLLEFDKDHKLAQISSF